MVNDTKHNKSIIRGLFSSEGFWNTGRLDGYKRAHSITLLSIIGILILLIWLFGYIFTDTLKEIITGEYTLNLGVAMRLFAVGAIVYIAMYRVVIIGRVLAERKQNK